MRLALWTLSFVHRRGLRSLATTSIMSQADAAANGQPTTWDVGRDQAMEECILPLSADSHKGSSGRIGVLGGSAQYTGAPYYCGISALQAGADLAYVFCADEAALAIKSYSPELMVSPVYSANIFDDFIDKQDEYQIEELLQSHEALSLTSKMVKNVEKMLPRLHCLVIGPGLGRCPLVMSAVAQIIRLAVEKNIHIVLDADALFLLSLPTYRSLIRGYKRVVLTPNVIEYSRLFPDNDKDQNLEDFGDATILKKGRIDKISQGRIDCYTRECHEEGGLKRSGGIGDVLAGTLGTLVAWQAIMEKKSLSMACWTACCIVKTATRKAFEEKRRSMTAPDVLKQLGPAIIDMTER